MKTSDAIKFRRDFYEPQLFHDHFQNFKAYNIPRAQLVIADVPYNLGKNAYASNPSWYKDGDNKNGESELAGKMFFESDADFSPAHFMIFCERLLRKETKDEKGGASCGGKASSVPLGVARCAFNLAIQGHPMRAAGAPFDFVGDPGPFWKKIPEVYRRGAGVQRGALMAIGMERGSPPRLTTIHRALSVSSAITLGAVHGGATTQTATFRDRGGAWCNTCLSRRSVAWPRTCTGGGAAPSLVPKTKREMSPRNMRSTSWLGLAGAPPRDRPFDFA